MREHKEYQEALDILKDLMSTETENNHTPRDYQRATEYIQELVDKSTPKKVKKIFITDDEWSGHNSDVCPICGNTDLLSNQKYCEDCGQSLRSDK